MRYGVVSDIHGNLPALVAAVGRLQACGAEVWICPGDIVGYGPQPNECIETLVALRAVCVAGNHDLLALGRLPLERSGRLARETTGWTRGALSDDSRRFLAGLPLVATTEDMVVAHGSLDDPERYVVTDDAARRELDALDGREAELLVLGHTHRPWLYSEAEGRVEVGDGRAVVLPHTGRSLLNPGSVGQSRQPESRPRARFALVDTCSRSVRFFAEEYDVEASLAELRRQSLPRAGIHVRPGAVHAVPRRARTALRALGRRR
jgi:predicted phosphodiesterase